MPEYLRHVHERGLAHYVGTGERHVSWDGIPLPGLHKNGEEIPLMISFSEARRSSCKNIHIHARFLHVEDSLKILTFILFANRYSQQQVAQASIGVSR